jgi:hypothetical protein
MTDGGAADRTTPKAADYISFPVAYPFTTRMDDA